MPSDDRIPAPAVRESLALAELAEFALRAPHLDFKLARRRAIADALTHPAPTQRATCIAPPLSARLHVTTARRQSR